MDGDISMSLAAELESLAALLEAGNKKKRPLTRILQVMAFLRINKLGKGVGPEDIDVGDELYWQGINDPASGILSKDASQTPFGRALEALAAGLTAEIAVEAYEKRWQTDANPCPVCDENSLAGWIPMDETFPSGDDEPLAHPNCYCELVVRRGETG